VETLAKSLTVLTAAGLAVGGYHYAALWPQSRIFGATIVGGNDPRELALTFDDGPNDACTERLLEVLARYPVKATFFMVGEYVRQRPQLARAVRDAGHLIGNHTVTHPKLLYCSPRRVREELTECNAILEDTLGQPVRYFRPPFGARRPDVLRAARALGLAPVMWNCTGYDWGGHSAERIVADLEAGMRRNRGRARGSNLLLHDGGHLAMGADRSRTLRAVELLLERHTGDSQFVTVDRWNNAGAAAAR
jgi:peptidoglycan-N-acetylglucosamine deacetylase